MLVGYIDGVIRRICIREGGYVNDPDDAGGPTKYGITLATLAAWRKKKVTPKDVENLQISEACQIYKVCYVERPGYLKLGDDALAEQLIDAGVNHGVGRSIMLLQEAIGAHQDGGIGPETISKYQAVKPSWKVVENFLVARLKFYAAIIDRKNSQKKYAAGWMRRCAEMMEIYVAAVEIDPVIENKMLQVARQARKQAAEIEKSRAIRDQSVKLFTDLANMMRVI